MKYTKKKYDRTEIKWNHVWCLCVFTQKHGKLSIFVCFFFVLKPVSIRPSLVAFETDANNGWDFILITLMELTGEGG